MNGEAPFSKHSQQMAAFMMCDLVACFMLPAGQGV
jgi:hypothetical protein